MTHFVRTETIGNFLIVTLDRPAVLNSLHAPACHELSMIWDDFLEDDNLWLAIVTGTGDQAFCAGHDLVEDFHAPMPKSGWAGLSHRTEFHKPLIAAVNGARLVICLHDSPVFFGHVIAFARQAGGPESMDHAVMDLILRL